MIVLLDLDGVLVDFTRGCGDLFGVRPKITHWNCEGLYGETRHSFWEKIAAKGHDFWANLEWTPEGKEILLLVEEAVGVENIFIASTPCSDPFSASGKMEWLKREMPAYARRYMLGAHKYLMARSGVALLDDSDSNVAKFNEHGGQGVLVPRDWNENRGKDVISEIHRWLASV